MTGNEAFAATAHYRSSASRIICLYGDQGDRKSTSIADTSWPDGWKVWVHDIDGGFEFARQKWDELHPPANLTVAPGGSEAELHEGLWSPPPGYNLYVIDTYTSAMKKFKRHVNKPKDGVGMVPITNWREIGGKISGLALDYFEQWLQMVNKYEAWGIVVCHQKQEGDDPPKLVPALVGQARADVAGTANFVLHVEDQQEVVAGKKKWKKVFRTRNHPTVMAKDRSGALDPFEPMDLAAIIAKVNKKRGVNGKATA